MFTHTKCLAGRYEARTASGGWISVDVYSVFRGRTGGEPTVLTSFSVLAPEQVRGVNATSRAILAAELARVRLETEAGAQVGA